MISAPTHPIVPLPLKDPEQVPEFNLKEQECLSLLKRCKNMEEFKQVHGRILKWGLFCNSFCASNVVATCALSEWGSMAYACSIFRQIGEPHVFDYNTMIKACVNDTEYFEDALQLFVEMLERGVEPDRFTYPALLTACAQLRGVEEGMQIHGDLIKLGLEGDHYVQNSLINLYGKCRKIEFSRAVFEQMEEKSVASWSAVISAHSSSELWSQCLMLFREMNRLGLCRAEESVLVSVLSACTHLGALHQGRCIHGSLLRNITELNVAVQTSLIDMYMKCGLIEKALLIFHNIKKKKKKNHLMYSAVISGLAMHGRGPEALRLFQDMVQEGLEPDHGVYIGVLTACSHSGLVEEGLDIFKKMKPENRIEPTVQHYGCMVDLLGRAGRLQEALELIRTMPMEPNEVIWRSLLSACKAHHEIEIGEVAANRIFRFGSGNCGDYLALSGLYAGVGRWADVARVWKEMAYRGVAHTPQSRPGFSSVEMNQNVYRFVSQDKKFPQVYDMIHQMEWQLKFEGYSPDISLVLIDGDEEEKKQRLRGHSQKLAIAFALIHTLQGSPIRITRNLRMCSDCHTCTKYISSIYNREITVRDRNRFHHFKDGTCSCRDYW